MPLTPEQQQELQELRRIDELEAQLGKQSQPQPKSAVQQALDPKLQDPQSQEMLNNMMGGMAGNAVGAAVAPGLGKLLKPVGNMISSAAQRSGVLDKVKKIGELEPYVQGKINEAKEMFGKKQIGPRMLEQESRVGQNTVKIDPKSIQGLSPELDEISKSLAPNEQGLAEIPATEGLKIRQHLNKVAGWKSSPMDAGKAQAIDQQAAGVHQNLAQQFSNIDPAMEQLSQEMQGAYNTQKQAIGSAGKNPIGSVLTSDSAPGLAKKGRLSRFDEQAGSNLGQLGENISTANERLKPVELSDLFSLKAPKVIAQKAGQLGGRGFDAAAQVAQPSVDALTRLLQAHPEGIGQALGTIVRPRGNP